ncbi:MAG: hypothetical protein ACI8YQ_002661 [Polaribacter sp.]
MELELDFRSLLIEKLIEMKNTNKLIDMKNTNTHLNLSKGILRYTCLFLISISLFLVSCSDDLLIEKPGALAEELFYNTIEEIEAATNAIYNPLNAQRVEQIVILDTHTDWGYGRGSRADYNSFQGLNSANTNNAERRWNSFYLGIRNANIVIKNASNAESLDQNEVNKYIGEAKFLRALGYFDLVRNWGSVPLRTVETMTDLEIEKSSVEMIYDFIIADLLAAEVSLPETQTQIGRPTKNSAKTMLADVYLTLGKFSEARDKADEVIQSGKYSLVPVTNKADFQDKLFGADITTSPEEIFYFKCTRQEPYGNWILFVLNHASTGNFNFGGAYAHYSDTTLPFYTNQNNADIRKQLWDVVNFGAGATTLVCNKYRDTEAVARGRGAGNDMPIYRYAEVLLIYAEASSMAGNGPTAQGIEALNKVHRRAYGMNPNSASLVDYNLADYNKDTFLNLVLQERGYEFVFEGKRWYDLKRTGKAREIIEPAKGVIIAEKHFLWPIPNSELNFNKALDASDQNPGY